MASDFTVERNSTKWVLGAEGVLTEYIADAPAIEFNADGSYKGVLVEPQSINLCLWSEDFTQSGDWVPNLDPTVTANTGTAPDGTQTADRLRAGATGGQIQQVISGTSGTTYTVSFYIRRITGTGTINIRAVENINTPVTITNNWERYSVTATSTSQTIRIGVRVETDGDEVEIWGAQLEESPIATSYIPTTTGAVTRVKDDIYITGASSLIGQTEGTMFVEVDWQDSGNQQYLLSANDGTPSNRVLIYNRDSPVELRMIAQANGVQATNQGASSTSFEGIQKIAFAYKANDFELYRNGSSISTDTSGNFTVSSPLTDVDFGQFNDSSLQANMWIRAVALFTTRLSDPECEALTTL
jgi:hypothetical protein